MVVGQTIDSKVSRAHTILHVSTIDMSIEAVDTYRNKVKDLFTSIAPVKSFGPGSPILFHSRLQTSRLIMVTPIEAVDNLLQQE